MAHNQTPTDSRIIFVPMPPRMTYADGMGHLRTWLDANKVEIHGFHIANGDRGGFEITFANERDIAEFQLFDWPRA